MSSPRSLRSWLAAAALLLSPSLLLCGDAWARDEFDGLTCASDIRKALIGRRCPNGPVVLTERRHRDLGLKNLGGFEVSDRLFLVSWKICGAEYELLLAGHLIRDVLPFPAHSTGTPQVIGSCQADGKKVPETVLAILDNPAGHSARGTSANTMLPAIAAWRIDEKKERFVEQPTVNLRCRLGDVTTADRAAR